MATWQFPADFVLWIGTLAQVLDSRVRDQLAPMFLGLLFAQGRRTVASWLRAIGVRKEYDEYYYFLSSLGRKTQEVASHLLRRVQAVVPLGDRLLFGLDDTPTKRYGPCVEGAGIHHNPTPGPAGQKFLYGHVWVTVAWLVRHGQWGTIALPLLARLYVRVKDVKVLQALYGWKFQTKLDLAAELVEWLAKWLRYLGKPIWVVVDGAYAKRPFLRRAVAAGVTVVSRLRKDAALWSVPAKVDHRQKRRGRPRTYGTERISLAKRAAQKRGWQKGTFILYGREIEKTFKTFLATYRPLGGVIRVVLVQEDQGWIAFFCTDRDASVASILEAVADRAAIEQVFHDVKEVHGAGQPQLRNLRSNIGAWNLTLWLHTLVELWAWGRTHAKLCDRSASPWDDPTRRPSHADRCKALRHQCMDAEFSRAMGAIPITRKIRAFFDRLAKRAA